jgi:spore coat protein U-like protein
MNARSGLGLVLAGAATSAGSLSVQATVSSTCAVANAALPFGPVNPMLGASLSANVSLQVTCTQGTTFAVGLGDGQNASGGQRRMKGAISGQFLSYELYQDSGGATRFGDTVTAQRVANQVGLGATANAVAVYGSVLSGQNVTADTYADTVPITIYY